MLILGRRAHHLSVQPTELHEYFLQLEKKDAEDCGTTWIFSTKENRTPTDESKARRSLRGDTCNGCNNNEKRRLLVADIIKRFLCLLLSLSLLTSIIILQIQLLLLVRRNKKATSCKRNIYLYTSAKEKIDNPSSRTAKNCIVFFRREKSFFGLKLFPIKFSLYLSISRKTHWDTLGTD